MARKGRKTVNRQSWLKAGGPLPLKPPGLQGQTLKIYQRIRTHLEHLGIGGAVDLDIVIQTSHQLDRISQLNAIRASLSEPMIPTPSGLKFHPVFRELTELETKVATSLQLLYLCPRTRGHTKLPAETVAEISAAGAAAQQAAENPILRLLGG